VLRRLPSLALLLAALTGLALPAVAGAQAALPTSPGDLAAALLAGAAGQQAQAEPGTDPTTPAAAPPPVATDGASATTPVPPPYLVPGPAAATQPISSVARLEDADVPLEPVRLAALIGALLAAILVALSVLLRTLGLRTPVVDPVPAPGGFGPMARLGDRLRGTADDMRDFLRRAR
jgi:hypothetical protein